MGLSTHTKESFELMKKGREATALRLVASLVDASSMIPHFTDEELMHLRSMLRDYADKFTAEIIERE